MPIRIVTWNVNGIRNPFKYSPWNKDRTLQAMFDLLEADIVCFQEVKTPKPSLTDDLVFVPGWDAFYSFPHSQTGYSGVSVYTRDGRCAPTRVEEGVTGVLRVPGTKTRYLDLSPGQQIGGYPTDQQLQTTAVARDVVDSEGRCLVLEFALFVLVNVYCPARRNDERTDFRDAFLVALDARVRNLAAAGKNVVLCGDMNTMRDHVDTAAVWGHQGQKLVPEALAFDEDYLTLRSARLFRQLLFHSRQLDDDNDDDSDAAPRRPPLLYDACRELHPQRAGMYTCWDTRKNHRPANFGSRIDFVLCSPWLMQHLVAEADIQPQLLGSDHCPVYVVLRERLPQDGRGDDGHPLFTLDGLSPPGRFVGGQLALTAAQDAALLQRRQPQSARRLPQFSHRQHIGNLFRRPPRKQVSSGALADGDAEAQAHRTAAPFAAFSPDAAGETGGATTTATMAPAANHQLPPVAVGESSDEDDAGGQHGATNRILAGSAPDQAPAAAGDAKPCGDNEKADEKEKKRERKKENQYDSEKEQEAEAEKETAPAQHITASHAPTVASAGRIQPGRPGRRPVGPAEDVLPASRATPTPFAQQRNALVRTSSFLRRAQAQAQAETRVQMPPKRVVTRPLSTAASASSPSSSSSSSASSLHTPPTPSRPVKKAKTGIQTSISRFLQPQRHTDREASAVVSSSRNEPDCESGPVTDSTEAVSSRQPAEQPADETATNVDPPPSAVVGPEELLLACPPDDTTTTTTTPGSEGFWAEINDGAMAGWSALGLGQRQAPLCEHGEPCKTFMTRKPGVNSGRSFYMCARPPGPLGRREKGTAWQCTTFVWCRDWKPGRRE